MSKKPEELTFAIPLANGKLSAGFSDCRKFVFIKAKYGRIVIQQFLNPPPEEPGWLPRWLCEQGVDILITADSDASWHHYFQMYGIELVTGAPILLPEALVYCYLADRPIIGPGPVVAGKASCA